MGQITRARAELKRSTNLYNDIKDNAAAQQSAVEEAKNLVLKDQLYL